MEREIRNFINLIKKGETPEEIEVDSNFMKLIALLEKNDGICPICNINPIQLSWLINGKVLTCSRCEQERRYGGNRVPLKLIREGQLNHSSVV